VSDAAGHSVKATAGVTVSPALGATAGATPSSGQAPLTVSLSATPSGGRAPYTYSWNFGDASAASSSQNPTHVYANPGTFVGTVTITDANGRSAAASAPAVTVTPAPLAAYATASPSIGDAPLATSLTAFASGGTAPFTYAWALGDGGTSTQQNPSHTFGAGTYTVTLTITDSATKTASATVHVTVYPALVADVTVTPVTGTSPLLVNLSAAASGGLAPYVYSWVMGDGSTATGPTASHAYAAGTFDPILTIHDAAGGSWTGVVARIDAAAPAPSGDGGTTGGSSGVPPASSSGTQPVETPTATPSASPAASPSASPGAQPSSTAAGGSTPPGGSGDTPPLLIVVGSLLASGVGGLLFVEWRRRRGL
jgi:PKD repeat protein